MNSKRKVPGLSEVLEMYRCELSSWSLPRLRALATASWEWFTEDGFENDPKCTAKTKKGMVQYILGWDPIAAPGGVLDFLCDHVKTMGICNECHRKMLKGEIGDEDRESRVCNACAGLEDEPSVRRARRVDEREKR